MGLTLKRTATASATASVVVVPPPTVSFDSVVTCDATRQADANLYLDYFVSVMPDIMNYVTNVLGFGFNCVAVPQSIMGIATHEAANNSYRISRSLHGMTYAYIYAVGSGNTAAAATISAGMKQTVDLYLPDLLLGSDPNGCHPSGQADLSLGSSGDFYPNLANARGIGAALDALAAMFRTGLYTTEITTYANQTKTFLDAYNQGYQLNNYGTGRNYASSYWTAAGVDSAVGSVAEILNDSTYQQFYQDGMQNIKLAFDHNLPGMQWWEGGGAFGSPAQGNDVGHSETTMWVLIQAHVREKLGINTTGVTFTDASIGAVGEQYATISDNDDSAMNFMDGENVGVYGFTAALSPTVAGRISAPTVYSDHTGINTLDHQTLGATILGKGLRLSSESC